MYLMDSAGKTKFRIQLSLNKIFILHLLSPINEYQSKLLPLVINLKKLWKVM